jgi:3-oxoacyl-[acyl-carrier protein] reductase
VNEANAPALRGREIALPQPLSLVGRHVLVTGVASGIGRATALTLARLGADLRLTDRAPTQTTRAAAEALGSTCTAVEGDLTNDAFLASLVDVERLDAVVHCAGYYPGTPWSEEKARAERFRLSMEVNVRVPMTLATLCIEKMAPNGGGSIVLLGSVAGRNGGTSTATQPDYAISKGALHTLVRWLSRQAIGKGIHVNAVAPGPVDTPMAANIAFDLKALPMGRLGSPEEIAWLNAFLCTPAASYLSGAIIDANGGTFVG